MEVQRRRIELFHACRKKWPGWIICSKCKKTSDSEVSGVFTVCMCKHTFCMFLLSHHDNAIKNNNLLTFQWSYVKHTNIKTHTYMISINSAWSTLEQESSPWLLVDIMNGNKTARLTEATHHSFLLLLGFYIEITGTGKKQCSVKQTREQGWRFIFLKSEV